MANYKLVDADKLDADLKMVADAIRAKTGDDSTLVFPSDFASEIANIETGGAGAKPFDCHSVTFMNGSEVLYVRSVADGDTCADPVSRGLIDTPTKESDVQYNYTFYGWGTSDGGAADDTILQNVTKDKTVYAIFTATVRTYTITWLDEDGSVLKTEQVAYGRVPSYTPTKEGLAFDGWTPTPTKVTGDASYTANWTNAIASGTCGDNIRWLIDGNYVMTFSGTGAMPDYSDSSTKPWQDYRSQIKAVVFEEGITHIGTHSFGGAYTHTALTSVTIADSVISIGNHAFYYASAIKSVKIGNGVQTIGAYAFLRNAIEEIVIPDSVTSIGSNAFQNCDKLTTITIPNGVTQIHHATFHGCTKLASVTFGSGIVSIAGYIFGNCTALSSVTFRNTSGWYVTATEGATSGTTVDVTDPATNAANFKDTNKYLNYYWYRNG